MNNKPRKILTAAALLLAAALVFHQLSGWARFDGRINRLGLDLARPDGLIQTPSLSRLPADLLRVPLLKDVLREDFVFYYEHNEERLSLAGSLRRLAYEHELQWQDRLLAWVLDEPAEIAFWRDAKGAIDHYAVAVSRNVLARAVQEAATLAMKDRQLSLAAEIRVGGDRVPVLAFRHGRERSLLVASRGNRVVILSDPGMLLTETGRPDDAAVRVLAQLLSADAAGQQAFGRSFGLGEPPDDHRLVVAAHYLSFGYQSFFPGIEALRFDFGGEQWTTAVRLAAGTRLAPETTARALPARPAACAWLPVTAPHLQGAPAPVPALATTGAACWYGGSSLHTPLFVAELAAEPTAAGDEALAGLYGWLVKGEATDPARRQGAVLWQHRTTAAYGSREEDGNAYYLPTLARRGRLLIFSPDDKLVARALDTLERRYPSVADALPAGAGIDLAVFTPHALARLARQAAIDVLPRSSEPVLRDAADTHMLPRLAALEKHPAYRLVLPRTTPAAGWQAVEWRRLAAKP